jgi:NTP pyrophosphatase (non-canonical NTP hydrolase)
MNTLLIELHESSQQFLNGLQQQFHSYQVESFPQRQPEFFCLELCGEAGELANLEKKKWKGQHVDDEDLADEVADVFIALMNYSNARGLRLGDAVRSKLARIEVKRRELELRGEKY